MHIPFCRALCWLWTCRTHTGAQTGGGTGGGTARYLDRPGRAIARADACLPAGIAITRMYWGGGSPSVLTAAEIAVLLRRLARAFDIARGAQFTMEIARRDVTDALLETLAAGAGGLTRVSIPAIDHDAPVRRAINRAEDCDAARRAAAGLRARGASIAIDALCGLPRQPEAGLRRTLARALNLAPDRVTLAGYAHAPWIAQRQRAIAAAFLPGFGARGRPRSAAIGSEILAAAGRVPVGINSFARPGPGDPVAEAAVAVPLWRAFQGYVADPSAIDICLGASAIRRLPVGYAPNAAGALR